MSLRICVLASGSSGNCILVDSDKTKIIVDAGLSCRETGVRLALADVAVSDVEAVCVTHEHDDHRASLGTLHRRYDVAMYANAGTVEGLERDGRLRDLPWNVFATGTPFEIGDFRIEPFSVPHDSYDPVGFVISTGDIRVGLVTDTGMATGLIRERLKNCSVVVMEANHDEQMLMDAARPWSLKQRIGGRQGHLSNSQAAELAVAIAGPQLRTIFLAHLSTDCNRPELAFETVSEALQDAGHGHVEVQLTYPDRISELVCV